MQLPSPVRAAVGLVAIAADEARRLPDRAVELPMLAVSTALQASLRAQQRWARLTARGDEVLQRTPTTDEPPPWATFDDPVDDLHLHAAAGRAGRAGEPSPAAEPSRAAQSRPLAADKGTPDDTDAPPPAKAKRVSPPRHKKPSAFDDAQG